MNVGYAFVNFIKPEFFRTHVLPEFPPDVASADCLQDVPSGVAGQELS